MFIQGKWLFGITAIICFTVLQIIAWYLGFDGQVFAFTSSAITGILMFLTGVNLMSAYSRRKD